jgi:SHS2 domain-containing protein
VPYRWLEEIAIADAAFEAWADTPEELFADACDATLAVMVADPERLEPKTGRDVRLEEEAPDLLLFGLLQELLFYKDAERLLLRPAGLRIERGADRWALTGRLQGEELDPGRHELRVDVKAVTLHRLAVEPVPSGGWRATVVLDV